MSETPTGDLEVPVPDAEMIRRYEFAVKRRGYDIDQVRDYLGRVADQVETLELELGRSKAAEPRKPTPGEALAALAAEQQAAEDMMVVAPPPPPIDEYELLGQRFASLIETADREATAVVDEAKAEAERILEEARSEADRIRVDAQARAEEARQEASEALVQARREADRILGSLSDRRENLVTQMHEMQSRLLAVANDLEIAMDDRDEAINDAVARRTGGAKVSTPPPPASEADDDPVDPRYEDLWASDQKSVEIPDLEPIDLDFGEDRAKDD
jgi:cell division initiation protein